MKLLWLSHFAPYPPRGGAHQRSFNLIRQAAKLYDLHLIAFNMQREPAERLEAYASALKQYCRTVEFWELPLPWKGARWWAALAFSPLFRDPFSPRAFWSKKIERRWREVLQRHPDALLHLDSPDLALFTPAAARFRKVLNHHNCESAMARRRAQLASGPLQKTYLNSEARKLARLETRVCPQCNVNLTVSADDAELLRQNNPAVHAHVVENGTDTEFFHPLPVEEEPNTIVFAGSLNWYPNLSALEYFRREVWQLLKRESPRIRFYVAGMRPPEWLAKWAAADSRVTLVADPDDIRPWIARAAVCICPILDGGGTRLKILDAMAMGKAMVSTRFASEGLRVQEGKELLLAATAEEFAAHVLCLLRDDRARSRMATAARSLVEREYSWQRIGEQLQAAYRCALGEGCGEPARMRAHANVEA